MECTSRKMDKAVVIQVTGRMDAVTAPDFDAACGAWIDQGETRLVVDLTALEYISSAGLRSFLVVGKRLKGCGGTLALSGLDGMVREVFDLSGFAALFPVHPCPETALEALG
jgi:anti-anti-sigma factor